MNKWKKIVKKNPDMEPYKKLYKKLKKFPLFKYKPYLEDVNFMETYSELEKDSTIISMCLDGYNLNFFYLYDTIGYLTTIILKIKEKNYKYNLICTSEGSHHNDILLSVFDSNYKRILNAQFNREDYSDDTYLSIYEDGIYDNENLLNELNGFVIKQNKKEKNNELL